MESSYIGRQPMQSSIGAPTALAHSRAFKMNLFTNPQVQLVFLATFASNALRANCAIITSVNYVFEGFSPYSMVRFFEFNDRGWNISDNCLRDTYNYLEGLRKGSIWAIKLYDATSYYSGGAYGGNNFRIYIPQLCRNLEMEYKDMLGMHWNLRVNTTVVPFPVTIVVAKYDIEMTNSNFHQSERIQQMICLPKSCNDPDLVQILDIFMFQSNHIVKNISYVQHRIVKENFDILQDGGFYTILILIGTSILMFTLSHFSNYCPIMEEPPEANTKPGKLDSKFNIIEEYEKLRRSVNMNVNQFADRTPVHAGTFTQKPRLHAAIGLDVVANSYVTAKSIVTPTFLQDLNSAVSLPNILFELLKREHDAQAAMSGILAMFTFLLIYANTCAEMDFISNNKNTFVKDDTSFRKFIRKQATYLFDVFFFISGSNLTYSFFKIMPNGNWNVFEQLVHLTTMFVNKVCSVSLSYAFVLIALELTSKYFHFNTVLEVPSFDFDRCEVNKWRNTLYIETFLPLEERCMPWTWFISIEVQFFAAGCLVLLLAQIHPKYAAIICSAMFITSVAASTFLEMNLYGFDGRSINAAIDDLTEFNLIYDKVWLRVPLYILGMCLGYILHKTNGNIQINLIIFLFGWIACLLIVCFFLFGYQFTLFRASPLTRACVITLGHTMWAMIIFWIILASTTQYGGFLRQIFSYELMNIIGKLSTTSLILGPFVIRTFLLAGEVPFNTTEGQVFIMFMGFSAITYVCALALFVLFDSPLREILGVITKRNVK